MLALSVVNHIKTVKIKKIHINHVKRCLVMYVHMQTGLPCNLTVGALHKFHSHFILWQFWLSWQLLPVCFPSPQGTSGNDGPPGPPGERVSVRSFFYQCLLKCCSFARCAAQVHRVHCAWILNRHEFQLFVKSEWNQKALQWQQS